MVTVGDTDSVPPVTFLFPDQPPLAVQLVELLAVQLRVDESPGPTKVGAALRVTTGTGLQVKLVEAAVAEQPLALQA